MAAESSPQLTAPLKGARSVSRLTLKLANAGVAHPYVKIEANYELSER